MLMLDQLHDLIVSLVLRLLLPKKSSYVWYDHFNYCCLQFWKIGTDCSLSCYPIEGWLFTKPFYTTFKYSMDLKFWHADFKWSKSGWMPNGQNFEWDLKTKHFCPVLKKYCVLVLTIGSSTSKLSGSGMFPDFWCPLLFQDHYVWSSHIRCVHLPVFYW